MSQDAAPPPPAPGPRRRRTGGILVLAATGALAVTAVFAALLAPSPGSGSGPAASGGHGTLVAQVNPRAVQVSGDVRSVTVDGVSGQLAITGTRNGPVRLGGTVNWTGPMAPSVRTSTDRATGALTVSVRCAPASPCTEDLRLDVPAGTGTAVDQPAGRITAAGLAGPLALTAAHADITATDLRSPALTARITSGHLAASFTAPPARLAITLSSAQSTIRLPGSIGYDITQDTDSGYVRIAVPQASGTGHTVTARVHSGELELLPS